MSSPGAVMSIPLWRHGCPRSLELRAIDTCPADRITRCPPMFADESAGLEWAVKVQRAAAFRSHGIVLKPSEQLEYIAGRQALLAIADERGLTMPQLTALMSPQERWAIVHAARLALREHMGTTPA